MKKNVVKKIRLERLLSNLGYGGRKEMAMAIRNEWLEIDGKVVKDPSLSVDLVLVREGRIIFDGTPLDPPAPFTVMLHKPTGYTCSHKDAGDLVYDLMPQRWKSRKPAFSSIGRLDKYSSGQLLFTDDGELLHRIIHPKSRAHKHYRVTLRDDLKGGEAEIFASGTFCMDKDDKPLKPAEWCAEGKREGIMILSEGRFHQIRRMFGSLGNEVKTLHRFQTGNLPLGDLEEGTWRVLDEGDVGRIFE